MRIQFQTISWRHFLSAGPDGMTIHLDVAPLTLFVGANGSGKSSIIDALVFALFGRPFRRVPKSDLVSWANGEGALVELTFALNGVGHRVRRGIEPNLFEVFRGTERLHLAGKAAEQQAFFEDHILRLSAKAFLQIVVLGKAGYTPFMQLDAASRRVVVEDILDIAIFSRMSDALKPRVAVVKTDRVEAANAVRVARAKLDVIEEAERRAAVSHSAKIAELKDRIKIAKTDRKKLKIGPAPNKAEQVRVTNAYEAARDEVTRQRMVMRTTETALSAIDEDEVCPMCGQKVDATHKRQEKAVLTAKLQAARQALATAEAALVPIEEERKAFEAVVTKHQADMTTARLADQTITSLVEQMEALKSAVAADVPDRAPVEGELAAATQKAAAVERTFDLMARAANLLKDDGIKASVVRRFLPTLNREINAMLVRFGLPVQFRFDETFEETVRARYLHDCSHGSLSEGEKLRIELALLLCWRNIAARQASIDTNLLILDEVLDASLDDAGCTELLRLLREMSANVVIISHRKEEDFDDGFSRVLRFERLGDYSSIVPVSR